MRATTPSTQQPEWHANPFLCSRSLLDEASFAEKLF
jgi:hypothetical protein